MKQILFIIILLPILISCISTKKIDLFESGFNSTYCYSVKDHIITDNKKLIYCIRQAKFASVHKDFSNLFGKDTIITMSPNHYEYRKRNFSLEDSINYKNYQKFGICIIERGATYLSTKNKSSNYLKNIETRKLINEPRLKIVKKKTHNSCKNEHIPFYSLDKFERLINEGSCGDASIYIISKRMQERGYTLIPAIKETPEFEKEIIRINKEISGREEYRITRKLLKYLDLEIDFIISPAIKKINKEFENNN